MEHQLIGKIREKLDNMLKNAGFTLVVIDPTARDLLVYERYSSGTSTPDTISIHGGPYGDTCIYVRATSEKAYLKTVKELLPDYLDLDPATSHRWDYSSEAELNLAIEQIRELIQSRLLNWFEHPTIPPWNIPSNDRLQESLEIMNNKIKDYTEAARLLRAQGDEDGALRFEKLADLFREQIKQLRFQ